MIKNLTINFQNRYNFKKGFIHQLIGGLKRELNFEVNHLVINFIGSEKIEELNKKYLNHNYSTDILTFNYTGNQFTFDAEIFISIEDAKRNSKKFKVTLKDEITRLVIHGILHLLGYDDMKKKDKATMIRIENKLFNKFRMNKGFF